MAPLTTIKNPVRVAQDEAGSAFLVIDQSDVGKTGEDVMARIEYANGHITGERPLQQFFKFGLWLAIEDTSR